MNFYTYMWLRDNGTPYYVGKGQGKRAFRKGCPPRERIIIQEWPSEREALDAEVLLIAIYGRIDVGTGILRNLSDGGDGVGSGSIPWHKGRTGVYPESKIQSLIRRAIGNKYCLGKKRPDNVTRNLQRAGKPWSASRRAAANRAIERAA